MADLYDITGVTERRTIVPGGTVADVVQVAFTTKPSGATGTVDILKSEFAADRVDAVVAPYAAQLEAVRNL